jgi:hypothetical protein
MAISFEYAHGSRLTLAVQHITHERPEHALRPRSDEPLHAYRHHHVGELPNAYPNAGRLSRPIPFSQRCPSARALMAKDSPVPTARQ